MQDDLQQGAQRNFSRTQFLGENPRTQDWPGTWPWFLERLLPIVSNSIINLTNGRRQIPSADLRKMKSTAVLAFQLYI